MISYTQIGSTEWPPLLTARMSDAELEDFIRYLYELDIHENSQRPLWEEVRLNPNADLIIAKIRQDPPSCGHMLLAEGDPFYDAKKKNNAEFSTNIDIWAKIGIHLAVKPGITEVAAANHWIEKNMEVFLWSDHKRFALLI